MGLGLGEEDGRGGKVKAEVKVEVNVSGWQHFVSAAQELMHEHSSCYH